MAEWRTISVAITSPHKAAALKKKKKQPKFCILFQKIRTFIVENVDKQKEENRNYMQSLYSAITTGNILVNFTKFW